MEVIHDVAAFRARCEQLRQHGSVGLVLTMGALHDGHLSLVRHARRVADHVVATVFVNPTQFGPSEDLGRYPRELELDASKCKSAGVDLLFAPNAEQMYPPGDQTRVHVGAVAEGLCGATRAGHFEGVCTVVAKFFSLCGPCTAVFGEKDFQQLRVIEQMSRDLFLPVKVRGAPIVRELDGLAMSSRNRYLDPAQRHRSLSLVRALSAATQLFALGERRVERLLAVARKELTDVEVEYVQLVDEATLKPLVEMVDTDARLMLAARVGATRLIDNVSLANPNFHGIPVGGGQG